MAPERDCTVATHPFSPALIELSDPAAEEALYDSRTIRQFVSVDMGQGPVPNETPIRKFRHLLELHNPGAEQFRLVIVYLEENGM